MTYKGFVKGNVIVLEGDVRLPEGCEVEVAVPAEITRPKKGSKAALLEVAGTDIPEAWEEVERIVEEHDRLDREFERQQAP